MKKTYLITAFLFVAMLLALLMGCKQAPLENNQGNLFNESLNQQIENLTNTNISTNVSENISATPAFKEFFFNYIILLSITRWSHKHFSIPHEKTLKPSNSFFSIVVISSSKIDNSMFIL